MKRLLIRSGKDPFTPVSAETTVAQDVLHGNVGNHLYTQAVHKTLMAPDTEIISNSTLSETRKATAEDCARVNDEFDAFVVPLANAFRPHFRGRMKRLTTFIRGLKIPVVVIGVGAQVDDPSSDTRGLDPIAPEVKDFVTAVLDRSESIGVRGEFTRDYLTGLGFPDDAVEVIGCPSLFLHGPDFELPPRSGRLHRASHIAFSLTPKVAGIGEMLRRQAAAYPNLTYVPQDRPALELMLWGEQPGTVSDPSLPTHPDHPMYQQDRMRFFLDPRPWLDYLDNCDFAYGTRFHGNVAALLARTPAVLLAHDSRTLELAQYHAMPYRLISDTPVDVDPQDLFEEFDPAPFNGVYRERFTTFVDFLERNGLQHVYSPGMASTAFNDKMASTTLPPAVRTLRASDDAEVAARLRWLRDATTFDASAHRQAYKPPFPWPAPPRGAAESKAALEARLKRAERRLDQATDKLQGSQRKLLRQQEQADRHSERLRRQDERIRQLEARLDDAYERSVRGRLARTWHRVARTVRR